MLAFQCPLSKLKRGFGIKGAKSDDNQPHDNQVSKRLRLVGGEDEHNREGSRKALIVGINYTGKNHQLNGCINDAEGHKEMLVNVYGFNESNVTMLTDHSATQPTAKNIKHAIRTLMNGATPGDTLWFSYSGHGSQWYDTSGDEEDGLDECIVPLDSDRGDWPEYVILDDFMKEQLHDRLPRGASMTCVFDCCHSGTLADLAYTRDIGSAIRERFMPPPLQEMMACRARRRRGGSWGSWWGVSQSEDTGGKRMWTLSGCQDGQTSADARIDGKWCGALSWAVHQALQQRDYFMTYEDLLADVRRLLKNRSFSQQPMLQSNSNSIFSDNFLA